MNNSLNFGCVEADADVAKPDCVDRSAGAKEAGHGRPCVGHIIRKHGVVLYDERVVAHGLESPAVGFDVGVVAAALVVFGVEPLLLYRRGAVEPDAVELVERARENALEPGERRRERSRALGEYSIAARALRRA